MIASGLPLSRLFVALSVLSVIVPSERRPRTTVACPRLPPVFPFSHRWTFSPTSAKRRWFDSFAPLDTPWLITDTFGAVCLDIHTTTDRPATWPSTPPTQWMCFWIHTRACTFAKWGLRRRLTRFMRERIDWKRRFRTQSRRCRRANAQSRAVAPRWHASVKGAPKNPSEWFHNTSVQCIKCLKILIQHDSGSQPGWHT